MNERGEVLLKTWRAVNRTGARVETPVDLGWLVVSASGTWQEATHDLAVPQRDANAWIGAPVAWKSPENSVRALLRLHPFGASGSVASDSGAGQLVWSADHACVGARCTAGPVPQRTLGGVAGRGSAAGQLTSRFYRAGVAVVTNTLDGDGRAAGMSFDLSRSLVTESHGGMGESGFEMCTVDAVVIVPELSRD